MLITKSPVLIFVLLAITSSFDGASTSASDSRSDGYESVLDVSHIIGRTNCKSGDNCEASDDLDGSHGSSVGDSSDSLRRLIYSIPNEVDDDRSKYVYLNYKKAYGIRYDPTDHDETKSKVIDDGNAENCNQSCQSPAPALLTTNPVESHSTTTTTGAVPTELNWPSTTSMSMETSTLAEVDTTTEQPASTTTGNIVWLPTTHGRMNSALQPELPPVSTSPSSPLPQRGFFRNMLDYIGAKIKQFFTYGLQFSLPSSQQGGPRFLNLFNVIKFDNIPCVSSEMSGTCYHDEECRKMGGVAVDRCADGFGVCCACQLANCILGSSYIQSFALFFHS